MTADDAKNPILAQHGSFRSNRLRALVVATTAVCLVVGAVIAIETTAPDVEEKKRRVEDLELLHVRQRESARRGRA